MMNCDKRMAYDELLAKAAALMEDMTHPIANLSNLAALMGQILPEINWCGFYLVDGGSLLLGPFWGLPACIRIPLGRGVCGTAAQLDTIERVYNVHEFPGHIACDSASNSEIVLPLHRNGCMIGVLDIDSPIIGRFDEIDEEKLTELVCLIEKGCDFTHAGYTLQ